MAKLILISMFDARTSYFASPLCVNHIGEALRGWETACNDGQSMPSKHPADFQLFQLGEFDNCTGSFSVLPHPTMIGTALEYKKKDPQDKLRGLDI